MDYHYSKTRDPKIFEYFDKQMLEAFRKWNELVFKDGKLDRKTKEDLAEVIQIATALNAGACIAHRDMALGVEVKDE